MKIILKLFSIGLLVFGCTYHEVQPEYKFAAGYVSVGFKPEVTLRQAADFVNMYADSISHIFGFYYYSNLPADSLNFIIDFLSSEGITDVSVDIGALNHRIRIIKMFYGTDDKTILPKWIQVIENPVLKFEDMQAGKSMLLYIQPGTEKQWIKTHVNDPIISYAELDYILPFDH
jgi:hypothetical protein